MKFEPTNEVPPPMWCTGDLVIIKNRDGAIMNGTIIETSREWINHIGGVWSHTVLVNGRLAHINESRLGDLRIVRRVSDTSEEFWERIENHSKRAT